MVVDALLLPLPDQFHVVDAIGESLDVPEHHRGRGIHAKLMCDLHDGQPGLGIAFAQADLAPDGIREDLSSTARYRAKTGLGQRLHDPTEFLGECRTWWIEELDELDELRWTECMNMDVGEPITNGLQQVHVPI